jgi:hypothetical protein
MPSVLSRVGVLVIALLSPGGVIIGQTEATTTGTPSCANCRIVRIPDATVGAKDDAVLLGRNSYLVRDRRGRFYASAATTSGPQIAVYDSTGRQVSTFGQPGQGPGELQGVMGLSIGPGDTLYVYSRGTYNVFAPVGRFVRSFRLPQVSGTSDMLPLTGGRLLISQTPDRRNRTAGFLPTIRIATESGEVLSGFGMADTSCGVRCFSKTFAPSRTGSSVVAVGRHMYQLEDWELDSGRLLKRLSVTNSTWFKPDGPYEQMGVTPPRSNIVQAARDTGTLVWIGATTAASNWKPYAGIPPTMADGLIISPGGMQDTAFMNYMQRRLDRVIEVVDLARNTVLASQRSNEVIGLMDDGFAYLREEDAEGYVRFRVWRFALRVP